jgi:hypothetical protein
MEETLPQRSESSQSKSELIRDLLSYFLGVLGGFPSYRHISLPESVKDMPSTGMNCQV